LASARDITEPTAAVTKLAETQRLLQSVIEQSPVPMVVAAPDGTITIFNQACRDLLGIDDEPEPNTGINLYTMRRTWQDLDPAGNPIPLQDLPLAAALRGEHVRHREMKVQRKDGSIRWEIVDGVPVYAHDGTLIAGLIIFPDITDRKLAEENIANERERLAVTLRSIGDGVITTDTQGKITIMNKVAEDLTGWTLADALGKPLETVFTIIDERTRTPRENPVSRVLSSGQIIELANHTLLVGQDGSERVIADSGAPIRDSTGHTIGVVLVFRDMTEKRKLLDHLQRADKLDSLGILAGGIAHDFNNLLSGIFGYIELARELSTTDDPIRPFLDQALGVFDRATNLTRQLITFSKGGTPVRKIQPIGTLLQNSLRFALSGSQVTNTVAIARDLWPCHFDEHQIAQVVDNLAINALQAMPEGGTISLIAENCLISGNKHPGLSPGRYVKITISDSGIGIPPEIRNRIFDPFFTTREKGNGLGLAVCYSIMQKHDGTIEADSVPGKGATFTLYLPAADSPPPPHAKKTAPRHRGKGRIIIMDDESSVRKVAGGMLSSMGYEPVEARDSDEMFRILAAARQESPPVRALILDLTIPGGKGGKAVVVEVNRKYPDIPVFVTSGYSDDPVMASPTEYGFTGSIKKPFRLNDLAALLEQHLTK
ncbi:MAG TPA: PAS domain S-box protein, partial [Spirochaetia bacterium]|nr:PAS domain S-box protein [Spirochaetia bacterium]